MISEPSQTKYSCTRGHLPAGNLFAVPRGETGTQAYAQKGRLPREEGRGFVEIYMATSSRRTVGETINDFVLIVNWNGRHIFLARYS